MRVFLTSGFKFFFEQSSKEYSEDTLSETGKLTQFPFCSILSKCYDSFNHCLVYPFCIFSRLLNLYIINKWACFESMVILKFSALALIFSAWEDVFLRCLIDVLYFKLQYPFNASACTCSLQSKKILRRQPFWLKLLNIRMLLTLCTLFCTTWWGIDR